MKWLTTVVVALAIVPVATATTSTRHCRDVGPAQTDVGLYKVTANRITCRKARVVLRHWYNDPHGSPKGPRGWECRTHSTGSYASRTTCRRRRATIGFTRYSA